MPITSRRQKASIYILTCLDVVNDRAHRNVIWCPVCGEWKGVVREILSV